MIVKFWTCNVSRWGCNGSLECYSVRTFYMITVTTESGVVCHHSSFQFLFPPCPLVPHRSLHCLCHQLYSPAFFSAFFLTFYLLLSCPSAVVDRDTEGPVSDPSHSTWRDLCVCVSKALWQCFNTRCNGTPWHHEPELCLLCLFKRHWQAGTHTRDQP